MPGPDGTLHANATVLVLNRRGTTAERHERELKHLRILCTRFSEARRESFCPLDTDLSWTSAKPEGGAVSAVRNPDTKAADQRLWKSRPPKPRAWKSRKRRGIPTFPQPQQQQTSGY